MTVLITGGCGFIGQHLARRLAGRDLVALDNLLPQVHLRPVVSADRFPGEVVDGDVSDELAWGPLEDHADWTGIVHLAADTGTGQSMYEQDRYRRVNVGGTELAGAFAARHNIPLVALSSRAVYGEGDPDRASREDDLHRPVSFYGQTKSLGEAALGDLSIPVTILRPQNVVGPGQALHNPYTGVLAAFLARLREGRSLVVYGDGRQTRDFVHVDDVANLIGWCLDNPANRVLNCGTGERTTLLELAEHAAAGSPRDHVPIEHLDVIRAGDIEHACADLTRLRASGAPLPRWTSREAIIDFVRHSWTEPGAESQAWDDALNELADRGLIGPGEKAP